MVFSVDVRAQSHQLDNGIGVAATCSAREGCGTILRVHLSAQSNEQNRFWHAGTLVVPRMSAPRRTSSRTVAVWPWHAALRSAMVSSWSARRQKMKSGAPCLACVLAVDVRRGCNEPTNLCGVALLRRTPELHHHRRAQ
jgi:hypothetical protein